MKHLKESFTTRQAAVFLFFLALIVYTSVILIKDSVFIYDEGFYALMIKEFSDNPSMIMPTLAGEHVEWKPPLFVWVYSAFYTVLKNLNLSPEATIRLPSALFGALSVLFTYLIADRLYGKYTAIASAFLFLATPILMFSSFVVMIEAFSVFLILASIYLYITNRHFMGMLFLGMVVLTKWLYVIAPLIFLALYFIRKKEFPKVALSFLIVPFSLGLYLLLAYFFGSYDNAVMNLFLDILRPVPSFNPLDYSVFLMYMLVVTFPLSLFFAFFALYERRFWKESHLLAMGALAFIMPISQFFIFWYCIIAVPAMAIFVAKRMEGFSTGPLFPMILASLVLISFLMFVAWPYKTPDESVRDVAQFMKGKNITFLETENLYLNWQSINENYIHTEKSYLLLEQLNNGFLFYRFNDTKDYHNINALFFEENTIPPCSEYLILHGNASVPDCFTLFRKFGNYCVYESN